MIWEHDNAENKLRYHFPEAFRRIFKPHEIGLDNAKQLYSPVCIVRLRRIRDLACLGIRYNNCLAVKALCESW